ncbi:DUF3923 family protein [Staphylococcus sp.]|uniref:DUF3923 family protein n=1 Tax=Staphylococcus sp. TaxID=29387 RepID=UPI000EE248EC|nr:DUF3923 family protein [Staphylococcus sp.]HBY81981.1 DUF3923 domain-containing protein [Staphylococcus sp.]
MKISWISWWIMSILEIITFIFFAFMVWNRNVDAADVTQTTELKLVNLGVLGFAFLIPFIVQIAWLLANIVISKKQKNQALH